MAGSFSQREMVNPTVVSPAEATATPFVPVYPQTEGLNSRNIQKYVRAAFEAMPHIQDPLPAWMVEKYRLCSKAQAVRSMHFPRAMAEVHAARRRLIYEELLVLQLGLLLLRGREAVRTSAQKMCIRDRNKNEDASSAKLRAFLESNGDSVVVIEDDEVINCHVHTADPGKILSHAIGYGYLTNFKIENMHEQFLARQKQGEGLKKQAEAEEKAPSAEFAYAAVDPERAYGFVAVAAGEGLKAVFTDLGACLLYTSRCV